MDLDAAERNERESFPIDLSQAWQRRYWPRELGISEDELQRALSEGGSTLREVRAYLAYSRRVCGSTAR